MYQPALGARLQRVRAPAVSMTLWILAVALSLSLGSIWLAPSAPLLALPEQFAVQLGLGAGVGLIAACLLRRWLAALLFALLAGAFAVQPLASYPSVAVSDGSRLRVVSANLWARSDDHSRTIETLLATDADILGMMEVSPEWEAALAPVLAKYPHRIDCFAIDAECHTMVLSKLPFTKQLAGRSNPSMPLLAGGEVLWNGRPITILAMHLTRPLDRRIHDRGAVPSDLPASRQSEQIAAMAAFANTLPPDLIVMGDFNAVPWSRVHRAFRAGTGLESAAGWTFTWPRWMPSVLRLSIDHILTRGHLVVTRFEPGPKTDSDHLPVIAEIGWRD